MEEVLKEVLRSAGTRLADLVRNGLHARGFPHELEHQAEGLRVSIVSRAPEVHEAEFGTRDVPPTAPVEETVRRATNEVVRHFAKDLEVRFHERGL